MNKSGGCTEPIFKYRKGAVQESYEFGNVDVHVMTDAPGVDSIRIPDHVVFAVESDVVSIDFWEGERLPERHYMPGDVVFLPARSELRSEASNAYSETAVCIPDYWFQQISRMGYDHASLDFRYGDIHSTTTYPIAAAVRDLARAKTQDFPPLLVESMTLSLTVAVARSLSDRFDLLVRNVKNGLAPKRKSRVINYIESNLCRRITLENIAHVAAMSPYHFSRSFKRSMGISPVRYVWQRRVEVAKTMMLSSDLPLAVIAIDCGFKSQSHFTTAFKKVTGMTPAAYRRAA